MVGAKKVFTNEGRHARPVISRYVKGLKFDPARRDIDYAAEWLKYATAHGYPLEERDLKNNFTAPYLEYLLSVGAVPDYHVRRRIRHGSPLTVPTLRYAERLGYCRLRNLSGGAVLVMETGNVYLP